MFKSENGIIIAEPPLNRRALSTTGFFILAFFLSWTGAGAMIAGAWAPRIDNVDFTAFAQTVQPAIALMLFGPLIAALIALVWNYGPGGSWRFMKRAFRINLSPVWLGAVLIVPFLLFAVVGSLARNLGAEAMPTEVDVVLFQRAGQIFLFYVLLNTEEIAWRGYALPQMQARHSPFGANLRLTAIWIIFHIPLFLMPGGHPAGYSFVTFVILAAPLGMIMGAAFNRTGGSVIIVHLLHQSVNTWGEAFQLFPLMTNEQIQTWVAGALLAVLGLIATVWLVWAGRSKTP